MVPAKVNVVAQIRETIRLIMDRERSFITAVVNALPKAGIELGENGSIIPKPEGKR